LLKTGGNVKIKRILVFGLIGSGKSSVLKLFKESGAYTIDCDRIANQILEHDPEVQLILKEHFGPSIFEGGNISKKKLAKLVFDSKKDLLYLEKTIHPKVLAEVKKLYHLNKDEPYTAFVVEASVYPKVQEDFGNFFEKKIAVQASFENRLKRAHEKGLTNEEFKIRSTHQLGEENLLMHADLVLDNNATFQELKQQFLNKVST